jgi:hypothetical protein
MGIRVEFTGAIVYYAHVARDVYSLRVFLIMQTRKQSLIEAWTNVAIGWLVGLGTQIIVFPLYGMKVKLIDNMQITIIFTIVSLIRSYLLRRFYNAYHRKI